MKAIMARVYNSFSFYLISFVCLWFFSPHMTQLSIPPCLYTQRDGIEAFCFGCCMVSILFWSAYESSMLIKKINHSDGSSCSTKSDYPLQPQSPPPTIHLHSVWWQSMEKDSSRRETRLHPVVRQTAPHPGNNLVANWLEDGENWKLKLEILIINREEGGKKGQEMRCGNEIGPPGKWGFLFVMKCMWHASQKLQGYQSQGKKRLPSNLRLQKILWCSWKFVLCPCGIVFFPPVSLSLTG